MGINVQLFTDNGGVAMQRRCNQSLLMFVTVISIIYWTLWLLLLLMCIKIHLIICYRRPFEGPQWREVQYLGSGQWQLGRSLCSSVPSRSLVVSCLCYVQPQWTVWFRWWQWCDVHVLEWLGRGWVPSIEGDGHADQSPQLTFRFKFNVLHNLSKSVKVPQLVSKVCWEILVLKTKELFEYRQSNIREIKKRIQ
jgi:hypothetical protein